MQKLKNCPHCGSSVWVIPHEEPNCEVCGCDTDVPADLDEEIEISTESRPKRRSS